MTKLKEELAAPLRVMQEIARRIARVSQESKLPVVEDEYVQSFKVELMDAVVQWCRGASFSEICKVSKKNCLKSRSNLHPSGLDALVNMIPVFFSPFIAYGPIRGFTHPCFPTTSRTYPTDESSCQGHWQHRTPRKIRQGI